MKDIEKIRNFRLELAGIASSAEYIRDLLNQFKCSEQDIIRAQLFAEETIISWAGNAKESDILKIELRKRFKTISLNLSYKGEQFDPLSFSNNINNPDGLNISQHILIGLSNVNYIYRNGINTVTFSLKQKGINPALSILVALGTAILLGILVNRYASSAGQNFTNSFLIPLNQAFFGLLNAVVIPFLFVSVIAGIFNMESIAQMKHIFRILFGWFLGLSVLAAIIAGFAGILYFHLQGGSAPDAGMGDSWSQINKMLFDIVPTNIIKSFFDNNTLQIIFLAIISGLAMLTLKGRFTIITKVITECNLLLSTLLDVLCSLIPWVIFTSIFSIIISGESSAFWGAFGIIGLICACFLLFISICLVSVALIEKMNPARYIKDIGSVLLIAFSTATSSSTFVEHAQIARKKQGIRDYLVNFSIPVGALFSKPFMLLIVFLLSLFVGYFYQVPFTYTDIIPMLLLCMVLSIAVPPMPGMGIFIFTIAFHRFGIPIEGLAMAATLYTFLDYILTAGNVFSINISMIHTEYRLRKLEQ